MKLDSNMTTTFDNTRCLSQIIHEGLRRCVPGGPGLTNRGRVQNDAQAEWEDLPFDFENDDDDKLADGEC